MIRDAGESLVVCDVYVCVTSTIKPLYHFMRCNLNGKI